MSTTELHDCVGICAIAGSGMMVVKADGGGFSDTSSSTTTTTFTLQDETLKRERERVCVGGRDSERRREREAESERSHTCVCICRRGVCCFSITVCGAREIRIKFLRRLRKCLMPHAVGVTQTPRRFRAENRTLGNLHHSSSPGMIGGGCVSVCVCCTRLIERKRILRSRGDAEWRVTTANS